VEELHRRSGGEVAAAMVYHADARMVDPPVARSSRTIAGCALGRRVERTAPACGGGAWV